MDKNIKTLIETLVREEMNNMISPSEPDHEAKMAKGELRDMIMNASKLYKMISDQDNLPGWVSAYITLSSDYIHSVAAYMEETTN
jgi:hypothetical protein